MNATGVIALANAHGVSLTTDTKRIIAQPAAKLTPDLREAIRSHSAQLLEVLTRDNRCARLDSDTKSPGHAPDDRRQQDSLSRNTRQDDRRTTPSNSSTQGSTTKKLEAIDPAGPCPGCGLGHWWQLPGEPWHCRACEPDMSLTATTLTLPCHKGQAQPITSHAGLERTLEVACEGLNITPEQLCHELEAGGDLQDVVSGRLAPQALRLAPRTLALMRYRPGRDV
jgi:hypothetical protein